MTDTAKRLVGPTQLTNAAATKYTVPGATKAVVLNIHVVNTDTSDHTFTFSVGADAAGTRYYHLTTVSPGFPYDWNGFLELDATEIIQAYADANSVLTMTCSGVEIS